ncbi:uncharacterized protein PV07_08678 [Cladophialophora immunda]|uniref:Uncharacterized protein n=1 Tax=Cladophialophora immunda TaxID=569365 RepID=A0A0D2AKP3_9EURO|nr:uncharacterized protein PV07_08678 [Cladophialophora immunda]KIW25512.1 hypothetical protein PV07_08678 [Cladophialophora immunda]
MSLQLFSTNTAGRAKWTGPGLLEALFTTTTGGDLAGVAKAKKDLDQRRRALYDLRLEDAQEKYLAEANRLRAEGISTDTFRQRSRSSRGCCDHAALDIGGLMTLWTGKAGFGNRTGRSEELVFDDEAEDRSEKAMFWLLRYAAPD